MKRKKTPTHTEYTFWFGSVVHIWIPGCWLDKKTIPLRSRTAIRLSFFMSYLSSDEYSNELNYYHFCWRIRMTHQRYESDSSKSKRECVQRSRGYTGNSGNYLKCQRIQITQFDYLPLCCSIFVIRANAKWSRVSRIHKYVVQNSKMFDSSQLTEIHIFICRSVEVCGTCFDKW